MCALWGGGGWRPPPSEVQPCNQPIWRKSIHEVDSTPVPLPFHFFVSVLPTDAIRGAIRARLPFVVLAKMSKNVTQLKVFFLPTKVRLSLALARHRWLQKRDSTRVFLVAFDRFKDEKEGIRDQVEFSCFSKARFLGPRKKILDTILHWFVARWPV